MSYISNLSYTSGHNYNIGQNSYHSDYDFKGVQKPERRQFFCDYCKVAGYTI